MRKNIGKLAWALAGSGVTLGLALSYGVAVGQEGGPPAPPFGGPGGGRGGMIRGVVQQTDAANNAVLVRSEQGQQQWVQIQQGVTIRRVVLAKLEEVKEKDVIAVAGVPATLNAASVTLGVTLPPPQGGAPGQPGAGGPGGFPGQPGAGGPGQPGFNPDQTRVTGTVESIDAAKKQLVLVLTGGSKVTVVSDDKTRFARQTTAGVKDLTVGEGFLAMGSTEQRGEITIIQARGAAAGDLTGVDMRSLMGGFGGGGRESGFGGRGRRGGGDGQE